MSLSLDVKINICIGKAANVMWKLSKRVWQNSELTKLNVYQAFMLSILLYGSESCTTYSWQEKKLNSFHLQHILGGSCPKGCPHLLYRDICKRDIVEKERSMWMSHLQQRLPLQDWVI